MATKVTVEQLRKTPIKHLTNEDIRHLISFGPEDDVPMLRKILVARHFGLFEPN